MVYYGCSTAETKHDGMDKSFLRRYVIPMKRNAKTILAVLLVAVTLLGISAPAFAATAPYTTSVAAGYVQATEAVNIRKGPGTSYVRIGWMQAGAVAIRTGTSGNWTEISLGNGTYGYVSTAYLRSVINVDASLIGKGVYLESSGGSGISGGSSGSSNRDQYYATTSLNLRKGPGTSYARIGWLEKGETVTLISVSGNWAKVNWKGTQCYAFFKYLAPTSGSSGNSSGSGIVDGSRYYATTSLNLRKGPGTNYDRIGWLEKGESVTLISVTGNWAKVNWKGTQCYAFFKYLKQGAGSGTNGGGSVTVYNVTSAAVTAYYGPGTNYTKAGTLAKGTRIECLGTVGTWTMITWDKTVAYIPTYYVTTASGVVPNPGVTVAGYYTTTQNVIAYRGPGTNYASAGTLLKGLLVQVVAASDGWALINLNGQALYVQSRYLLLQSASSDNSWNGGSNGGNNWWQAVLDEADSTLVSFVQENRNSSSYGFKNLKNIYVTKPPRGYEFRTDDFSFSGSQTMNVTFRSQTNSDKATFIWYRNSYVCPDNYGYWNRFTSSGTTYYFSEHQSLGYSEAYWWYSGELFYARVPYSFTRTDATRFFNSLHSVSVGSSWNSWN
ncbi:MAG: hypothetical protein DBX63_01220 [Clostridia bacterium]|nr:MAG: hypothetical protein DBX63_01220 [Clostridia bacterium]